jgi:sugar/nucleoside kinase (ribokinase family)
MSRSLRLVGVGSVFIDDIVLPTGQTYMGQLGGGVVHALMGAAVWDERPGILACVGEGLPQEAEARLHRHLDASGLIRLKLPQIRAWQLFEEDGTRRELYRVKETAPFIRGAQPEHLIPAYRDGQAFYLLQGFEGIRAWSETLSSLILWEPLQQVMMPENRDRFRETLRKVNVAVVSPNLAEARAIYGDCTPDELVNALFEDGARIVALRMGERGSLVGERESGARHSIPAVPLDRIVDQTGAGNTYCGAFIAGLAAGKRLFEAGACGSVAASFCLEQIGVVDPVLVNRGERDRRYQAILNAVSRR